MKGRSLTHEEKELLMTEYIQNSTSINHYNNIFLQWRGWCMTLSLGLAIYSLLNKNASFLFATVFIIPFFYLTEAMWRVLQKIVIVRNFEIEKVFLISYKRSLDNIWEIKALPRTSQTFREHFRDEVLKKLYFRILTYKDILFFYGGLSIWFFVLFILIQFNYL